MNLGTLESCSDKTLIENVKGNSILFHGDCLNLMKKMEDNSVHLIVTDPPYFLDGFDAGWDVSKLKNKRKKAKVIGGLPVGMKFDKRQGSNLQKFFSRVAKEASRILCPGAFFLAFSSPRLYHRMAVALDDKGFEIRDMLAWRYKHAQAKAFTMDHFVRKMDMSKEDQDKLILSMDGRKTPQLRPQFESIVVAQNPKQGTFVENWSRWKTGLIDTFSTKVNDISPTTVFDIEKPGKHKDNLHLTVKPVELIDLLIRIFSSRGQTVLDPFVGSGTALIAARDSGRFGIGMEIHSDYYNIAVNRVRGCTGE